MNQNAQTSGATAQDHSRQGYDTAHLATGKDSTKDNNNIQVQGEQANAQIEEAKGSVPFKWETYSGPVFPDGGELPSLADCFMIVENLVDHLSTQSAKLDASFTGKGQLMDNISLFKEDLSVYKRYHSDTSQAREKEIERLRAQLAEKTQIAEEIRSRAVGMSNHDPQHVGVLEPISANVILGSSPAYAPPHHGE